MAFQLLSLDCAAKRIKPDALRTQMNEMLSQHVAPIGECFM
jgi:hypothetical protein